MKKPGIKESLIWGGLIVTVIATLWTSMSENEGKKSAALTITKRNTNTLRRPPLAITSQSNEFNMAFPERLKTIEDLENLFNVDMPATSPQIALENTSPPAIEIPEVPYTYAGKLVEDGGYIVFLTRGDRNYVVRTGDVLGKWRIKEIKPPKMILSYLPLHADIPMTIGEIN